MAPTAGRRWCAFRICGRVSLGAAAFFAGLVVGVTRAAGFSATASSALAAAAFGAADFAGAFAAGAFSAAGF